MIATGARYRKLDVPRIEEFEGASVYYAATLMEAQLCRGDPGRDRRRRQLGRPGGRVPLAARRAGAPDRPRGRPGGEHVPLPGRPDRAQPERGGPPSHGGARAVGEAGSSRSSWSRTTGPGSAGRSMRALLFVFIGAEPHTRLARGQLALDDRGFVLTGPDGRLAAGRETHRRCCSRPAGPACSPPATCAADRSSASPQPSARARWRCGLYEHLRAPGSCNRPPEVDSAALTAARRGRHLEHPVQVPRRPRCRRTCAGPRGLRRQQATTVDLLEVAVRKLVVGLRVLRLLVIDPEMPLRVLVEAVLLDERVLRAADGWCSLQSSRSSSTTRRPRPDALRGRTPSCSA